MVSERRLGSRWIRLAPVLVACGVLLDGAAAVAELPSARELAKRAGFSDAQIQQVLGGQFVSRSPAASNERELTAGFAFLVEGVTPTELIEMLEKQSVDASDPAVKAHAFFSRPDPKIQDLAGLELPKQLAQSFGKARAGDDLNLASQEIAALQKAAAKDDAAVEAEVRSLLLARTRAYQASGLGGIAPYDRDGETRSPADDLRAATGTYELLETERPKTHALLLAYPKGLPEGAKDTLRWSLIDAHGEPTLVLTHGLAVPDGEAWITLQRQFYVSSGYNCEQALVALLPVDAGTAVLYANRTSTDQVTGFGGGAKRSIGSKLLASQLESVFEQVKQDAGADN